MATNFEKAILALVIISIVLSAGSLFVLSGLISVNDKLASLEDKMSAVQAGLVSKELFPGETELYNKAKEEGAFVIFTTWDAKDILQLLAEFSKRYPGISTTYWSATGSTIQARVLQDMAANQKTVDLLMGGFATALVAANATVPYASVQLDKLMLNRTDMVGVHELVPVIGYNTGLINASDMPKSWEDMTDPKYKGMVCAGNPLKTGTHTSTICASFREYWGNDTRYTNFVRGIKALEPALYDSSSTMVRLVVAGEYAIGFGLMAHDVMREMDLGSPISYVQIAPVVATGSWATTYKYAPHPNTAKLFTEWIVSMEGQLIVGGQFRTPNRMGVPSTVAVETMFPSVGQIISPPSEFITNSTGYIAQYIEPIWNE